MEDERNGIEEERNIGWDEEMNIVRDRGKDEGDWENRSREGKGGYKRRE